MKASAGGYARAVDVPHALELMAGSEGAGRFLAGGQSLIAAMNMRLSEGDMLIDISKIPGLSGVAEDGENVRIYLDGKLKGTAPAPNSIDIPYGAGQKPTVAYTQHLGGIWYEGDVDEVAIYEGALTDKEVGVLYGLSLRVDPAGKAASTWATMKR